MKIGVKNVQATAYNGARTVCTSLSQKRLFLVLAVLVFSVKDGSLELLYSLLGFT